MPAVLLLIFNFLATRFVLVATWMSTAWLTIVSSTAATWMVRGVVITALWFMLPLPDWVAMMPTRLSALPPSVLWAMGFIELKTGIQIVFGAWGVRALIRMLMRVIG